MKPLLLWPSKFPRSAIEADLGAPAEAFMVMDVDEHRSRQRLTGLPASLPVYDPYHLSDFGPLGAELRARFRSITRGRGPCAAQCAALAAAPASGDELYL